MLQQPYRQATATKPHHATPRPPRRTTTAKPEFLECIKANCHGTTTSEPLAVLYRWGEDENTPNTFHFQEAYVGKAGFVAHTQAPHFAEWEKFAGTDPFTEEPTVFFFEGK